MRVFCGVDVLPFWLGSLLAGEESFPASCSSVALPRASCHILPGTTVPEPLATAPGGSRLRASFVPHKLQPLNRLRSPTNSCRPVPANPCGFAGTGRGFRLLTNQSDRGCAPPFGVSPVFTSLQTGRSPSHSGLPPTVRDGLRSRLLITELSVRPQKRHGIEPAQFREIRGLVPSADGVSPPE